MNTVQLQQHLENPASIQKSLNVSGCESLSQFVLHIVAIESLDMLGHHYPKKLLS